MIHINTDIPRYNDLCHFILLYSLNDTKQETGTDADQINKIKTILDCFLDKMLHTYETVKMKSKESINMNKGLCKESSFRTVGRKVLLSRFLLNKHRIERNPELPGTRRRSWKRKRSTGGKEAPFSSVPFSFQLPLYHHSPHFLITPTYPNYTKSTPTYHHPFQHKNNLPSTNNTSKQ